MRDIPPPSRPALGVAFWVAFLLPVAVTLLSVVIVKGLNLKGAPEHVAVTAIGISVLVCPLYCGIWLAVQWTSNPVLRVIISLLMFFCLGILYLAFAMPGCASIL